MIRLLQVRYGPGYFQPAGAVIELPADEERALVDAGRAERIEAQRIETAEAPPAETATKLSPSRKRKRT